jgi:hypothetical protein
MSHCKSCSRPQNGCKHLTSQCWPRHAAGRVCRQVRPRRMLHCAVRRSLNAARHKPLDAMGASRGSACRRLLAPDLPKIRFACWGGAAIQPATPSRKEDCVWFPTTPKSETDWMADDAVSGELVSAPNSLLTGKLTGNFANSGPQQRFPHLINELIQSLAAKFPTQRNREFLQP